MRESKHIVVTGGAGFIGSHLSDRLLKQGWKVTAVDNFDRFYSPFIKWSNVRSSLEAGNYELVQADIRDLDALQERLRDTYDAIVHLAAKAGVRPSIADPLTYQEVNVLGTQNMLELARRLGVRQFVFASSSSVYGVNPDVPWCEDTQVLLPISPYASTKVSGELLGHVYSHLYGLRFLALRFFTVYGPRQRPDLAIHKLTRLLLRGKPLPIYGDGNSCRDYTFIDDIVDGVMAAIKYEKSPHEVINLGGSRTISLLEMVRVLEKAAGMKALLDFRPAQPGDVPRTYADTRKARTLLGYKPSVEFETGVAQFLEWLAARRSHSRTEVLYA